MEIHQDLYMYMHNGKWKCIENPKEYSIQNSKSHHVFSINTFAPNQSDLLINVSQSWLIIFWPTCNLIYILWVFDVDIIRRPKDDGLWWMFMNVHEKFIKISPIFINFHEFSWRFVDIFAQNSSEVYFCYPVVALLITAQKSAIFIGSLLSVNNSLPSPFWDG